VALFWLLSGHAQAALTLEQALELAQQNDPWLQGSEYRQQALEAQSISAGSLPDPMVNLGFANLPTDSFEFDQEAMTQFKVGVSQVFPRGESRALQQKQLQLMGGQHPHQREDRRARVAVTVSHLWLNAYRARESIRLIEDDRALFENLVDVAQSSYSSALGKTRQQDLVRAQLELTRLEDRLTVLHEQLEMANSRLGEWLSPAQGARWLAYSDSSAYQLARDLPRVIPLNAQLYMEASRPPAQELAGMMVRHPAILSLENKIAASETGVELAEQKYHPQWRLDASYGYREDDEFGNDRADFFSVGVAFDLPLFTEKRQDQQLKSARARAEATRTEKWILLRQMIAAFETQRARLMRLDQRQALYRERLLEEVHEQAEASLTAYTSDDGDFAEVVRARIAELNARIDALDIDIDRLKTISQLNYFFAGDGTRDQGDES
jgi:outer membrane protein TolC